MPIRARIVLFLTAVCARAQVTVDAGFAGGNIIVEKIDGDRVLVRPILEKLRGPLPYKQSGDIAYLQE